MFWRVLDSAYRNIYNVSPPNDYHSLSIDVRASKNREGSRSNVWSRSLVEYFHVDPRRSGNRQPMFRGHARFKPPESF